MPHPDRGERPSSVFWRPPEVRLLSLAGAACGGACGSRSLCHPPGQADPLHRHDELCLRGGDGIASEVQRVVTAQPRNSVLTLSDLTGGEFRRDAITRMKEVAVFDRPYVKRA